MINLDRHRTLILSLSMAMLLSSVGLPVMVFACRMGTTVMTKSCAASCSTDHSRGERIAGVPCQAQLFFIDRNTTAYVPAKPGGVQTILQILTVVPQVPMLGGSVLSLSSNPTSSSPVTRDILLLGSTRLI